MRDPQLGRVAQERDQLAHHRAQVEGARRAGGRPHLDQELVEAVREAPALLDDDAQQLLLLLRDVGLGEQHLGRAADGGQRVADLVRDVGRHLAHRGQLLLHAHLALQLLDAGEVLEDHQEPAGRGLRGGQGRDREAQVQLLPVGRTVHHLQAGEPVVLGPHLERGRLQDVAAEQLAQGTAPHLRAQHAQHLLAEGVQVEHAGPGVGRGQAAVDAVDDEVVQLAQVGHLLGRLLQLLPGAAQALGQVGADEGDGHAGHSGDEHRVHDLLEGQVGHVREARRAHVPGAHRPQHQRVEGHRHPRHQHGAPPHQQHAAREHGDGVEQHEPRLAGRAAGQVDEGGDEQEVAHHLHVGLHVRPGQEVEGDGVRHGEGVREGDEEVERVDRQQRLGDGLHRDGDEEQGGRHDHPGQHEPLEPSLHEVAHGHAHRSGRLSAVS
jgi:hypothetical protein